MKQYVKATRKEDDYYYQGPFWIVANSLKDIHRGRFNLVGEKYLTDYNGNYINNTTSKAQKTHKKLWEAFKPQYNNVEYDYYPRGRVAIYEGTAFIHINSRINIPSVINCIIAEYEIDKLEIEIDLNDTYQGSHYDFQLK